jgi:regulatory protein
MAMARASALSKSVEQTRAIALRLLARRDHTAAELIQKLQRRHCPPEAIESVIHELTRRDYLDDVRFATGFLRSRVNRGYAPRLIRRMLQQKGVSDASIERALTQTDMPPEDVLLRRLCTHRGYLSSEGDTSRLSSKERARVYRFLLRRGFSRATIYELLQHHEA